MYSNQASFQEGWVGVVYALCMDMINSTSLALQRTTQEQNLFNGSLIKQIVPHLNHLNLENDITQFTGDGWLVMTDKEWKVPALCCFAYIMAKRFQAEMSEYTSLDAKTISTLRLGISSGLDMSVRLLDDTKHWVGDSARRSVRSSNCCYPNEVLVDYSVLNNYLDVLLIKPFDIEKRIKEFPGIKMEEMPDLTIMQDLNYENWRKVSNPEWFVYTLNQVGRVYEARALAWDIYTAISGNTELSTEEKLFRWNKLIYNLDSYSIALKMRDEMLISSLKPSLETYNILMSKAPSYLSSKGLMDDLIADNIEPSIRSYNILLEHIPLFKQAYKLVQEAMQNGLNPNTQTYEILMDKAENQNMANKVIKEVNKLGLISSFNMYIKRIRLALDYDEAKDIIDEMEAVGILPNAVTYALLLKKVNDFEEAEVLMEEMEKNGIPTDLVFE